MSEVKIDHTQKMLEVSAQASNFLNRAHNQYRLARTDDAKIFYALQLQMNIFHYEMTLEMSSLLTQKPSGFAAKVALKDSLHKMVEYERILSGSHIKKIIDLAVRRNFPNAQERIKTLRKEAGQTFKSIQRYSWLRNKATGHYDSDIETQVSAIKSIDIDAAQQTLGDFLQFNLGVLTVLRDVGKWRQPIPK